MPVSASHGPRGPAPSQAEKPLLDTGAQPPIATVSRADVVSGTASATLTRRGLLSGLAAAGAVTTWALTSTTSAAAPAQPTPSPAPGTPLQLFADPSLNYEALNMLGAAGYGASEVGEVITAVNSINAAGATLQAYTDTLLALADALDARSAAELRAHPQTAGACALRAAEYYARALFFILGTTDPGREQAVYQAGRDAWDRFGTTVHPAAEAVRIPYQGTSLPGWFFRSDGSGTRRPTLIMTNGSDGQAVDLWVNGAAAGLARGWNVLIYDGPGQGEALFVHKIPFTDRWEQVVTPIVDLLHRRRDVDADRIALTGLSMGGDLAPRAAAFEHRLAALVAMPGVVSPWAAFDPAIRNIVTADRDRTNRVWNDDVVPKLPPSVAFVLKKRYEPFGAAALDAVRQGTLPTDIWTPSQIIEQLDITAVAGQIRCPTLVLDYEEETFYPGQAQQLYDLLEAPKAYTTLTSAEGAQLHCSPMAPQRQAEVVFDYLDDTVGRA
jgi:alpha/beta hydrolase fold